jgi:hypothetical protein
MLFLLVLRRLSPRGKAIAGRRRARRAAVADPGSVGTMEAMARSAEQ